MFNKQIRTKSNLFCSCFMNEAYFVMFYFIFWKWCHNAKTYPNGPKNRHFFSLFKINLSFFFIFWLLWGKKTRTFATMMSQRGAGLSVAWQRAVCQRACVWFWFFWDVYDIMFCINVHVQLWCIISHHVEGSYEEIYFQTKWVTH